MHAKVVLDAMTRKAHRYVVGLLFLGCAAASPSTSGDGVISWAQAFFSSLHPDRSGPAKPHTIHTTRLRAAPGESHPIRHHGGAKPSVTKPPVPDTAVRHLHLSPAQLSAMLRHAPPHTEAKGIGAPVETQHRIGADVGYKMPELRRVRFGKGLGEFFVCASCETYGWVLQNSEESRVFNVFRAALRDGALPELETLCIGYNAFSDAAREVICQTCKKRNIICKKDRFGNALLEDRVGTERGPGRGGS